MAAAMQNMSKTAPTKSNNTATTYIWGLINSPGPQATMGIFSRERSSFGGCRQWSSHVKDLLTNTHVERMEPLLNSLAPIASPRLGGSRSL